MDTRGVVHCYTPLQHGHTGHGALLHGLAAWTHGGGAMLPGLGAPAGEGVTYSPTPSRIVCPGFFFRAIALA